MAAMLSTLDYTIRRSPTPLGEPQADWDSAAWAGAETLSVALWPWAPGTARHVEAHTAHLPKVEARLMWTADYLALMFRVEDRYVRAVAGHPWNGTDSVCTDSCVEFFVSLVAGSDAYLNCEVNPGGTMLIEAHDGIIPEGIGDEKPTIHSSIPMATTMPPNIDPEIEDPTTWCVEYHLPNALFVKYFGPDAAIGGAGYRANFYKCADQTSHPHWGCWSPVETPQPSFHQPKYFRPLKFDEATAAPGRL